MSKLYLIILLFEVLISKHWLFAKANECASDTKCKPIRECPDMLENFQAYKNKTYCNLKQRSTYVCCRVPPPKYTTEKDDDIRAVRECKSFKQLRPKCEKPLISDSQKAEPKEFPFMAMVFYKNGDSNKWLCSGTLISSKYVLTSANCFYTADIPNTVRLGELDYGSTTEDASPQDYDIKNYIIHPEYFTTDIQTKYNDIALIELASEVTYNDYIMPACLPLSDGREFNEYLTAGWGKPVDKTGTDTSHLRKVKLDRFEDSKCFDLVEKTAELETGVNNRTQMCAGSLSDTTRDTCVGDSGGPLFVDHPDYNCLFLILGVTSFDAADCGNVGYPTVYTRISYYLKWIEQIVWNETARLP